MTVMVVDDDNGIRDMLTQFLEDEGYGVVSSRDGQEALSYLRTADERPCVILLDLMMPVMNGWQFRQQQQQSPALANIPVIVLSARPDLNQQAANIDAVEHFAKPVDLVQLLDAVERICSACS